MTGPKVKATESALHITCSLGIASRHYIRYAGRITKLLIEKGLITQEEFMEKLCGERATYQKLLNPTQQ